VCIILFHKFNLRRTSCFWWETGLTLTLSLDSAVENMCFQTYSGFSENTMISNLSEKASMTLSKAWIVFWCLHLVKQLLFVVSSHLHLNFKVSSSLIGRSIYIFLFHSFAILPLRSNNIPYFSAWASNYALYAVNIIRWRTFIKWTINNSNLLQALNY